MVDPARWQQASYRWRHVSVRDCRAVLVTGRLIRTARGNPRHLASLWPRRLRPSSAACCCPVRMAVAFHFPGALGHPSGFFRTVLDPARRGLVDDLAARHELARATARGHRLCHFPGASAICASANAFPAVHLLGPSSSLAFARGGLPGLLSLPPVASSPTPHPASRGARYGIPHWHRRDCLATARASSARLHDSGLARRAQLNRPARN